jgi:hypothetical protein
MAPNPTLTLTTVQASKDADVTVLIVDTERYTAAANQTRLRELSQIEVRFRAGCMRAASNEQALT